MNDPIADMIIRLKNAGAVEAETATFGYSDMKYAICELLKKEGFIEDVAKKGKKVSARTIEVKLAYVGGKPKISGASRVSKFSKRVYMGFADVRPVRQGKGILVLSTPKGILSGKDAIKEKVGGEALFKLW